MSPTARDGLIQIPESYTPRRPAPLALLLHGAGQSARKMTSYIGALADETYTIILAPDSREGTWDMVLGQYGPDVSFLDRALDWTFARCAIDHSRMAIGGFSDGASYALSLGLANGDLFTHIIAFSPGLMVPPAIAGQPRIFISHGTEDEVLPIDATSRKFVPWLKQHGYRVRYLEFDGPHGVPPEIAREAFAWLTGRHQSRSGGLGVPGPQSSP